VKNYLGKQLFSSSFYPVLLVLLMWLVFFIQTYSDLNVLKLGVLPRKLGGLHGAITSVFVHGDLGHIASNSLPLLVLGTMLFYFYKKIAKAAFIWMWLISGLWLWIGGRNSDLHPHYHIGASTLVYGLASFLFFSGLFRRHLPLMVVSALVVFLYGSLVWGVFPIQEGVSWEGHLFGGLAGLLVAFNYRKEGPQRKVYRWENEEEERDEGSPMDTSSEPSQTLHIRYIYTKGSYPEESTEEEKKEDE
jgi:membrane associated rhomboid family serine protease